MKGLRPLKHPQVGRSAASEWRFVGSLFLRAPILPPSLRDCPPGGLMKGLRPLKHPQVGRSAASEALWFARRSSCRTNGKVFTGFSCP